MPATHAPVAQLVYKQLGEINNSLGLTMEQIVHEAQSRLWHAIEVRQPCAATTTERPQVWRDPVPLLKHYWSPSATFWAFQSPKGEVTQFPTNPVPMGAVSNRPPADRPTHYTTDFDRRPIDGPTVRPSGPRRGRAGARPLSSVSNGYRRGPVRRPASDDRC